MAACSRCATIPSMSRRWRRMASARSTWWWSISTRSKRPCAKGAQRDEIIENIDIGGPSMVRSAAKNHAHLSRSSPIPPTMPSCSTSSSAQGGTDLAFRRKLAAKAYALTGAYDSMIASWFAFADQGQAYPDTPLHRRQQGRRSCATAKTRIRRRRSTCRWARRRPASPRRGRCRARSSATTISTTPMPRWSWPPNSATARRRW